MDKTYVEIWTGPDQLEAAQENWQKLFKEAQGDNPYLSWEWVSTWWRHFGHNYQLLIFAAFNDQRLVGIFPLMQSPGDFRTFFQPVISFIGRGHLQPDYFGLLVAADTDAPQVVSALLGKLNLYLQENSFGLLELKWLPENSPFVETVLKTLKTWGLTVQTDSQMKCPHVSVTEDWDEYYASLRKKLRRDLRYARNRMEREGISAQFQRYDQLNQDNGLFDELTAVYNQRQVDRVGQGPFSGDSRPFLHELCNQLGAVGMLDISVLRLNDQIAAFGLNMKSHTTLYYWLVAYAPDFRYLSPGKLLIEHLIRDCFSQGYNYFDFMRGDEKYKLEWKPDIRSNIEIRAYGTEISQTVDQNYRDLRTKATQYRKENQWVDPIWSQVSKWVK